MENNSNCMEVEWILGSLSRLLLVLFLGEGDPKWVNLEEVIEFPEALFWHFHF